MFFVASKLFWFILAPSNALFLLGALAASYVAWRVGHPGARRWMPLAVVVLTGALAYTPAGTLALRLHENRFAGLAPADLPADLAGIIVLGGALEVRRTELHGQPQVNAAADRLVHMIALAEARPALPIVVSGGQGALRPTDLAEADAIAAWARSAGVDADRLVPETRSRNTRENAVLTRAALAGPEAETVAGRWLLVTSAFHMPRAVGAFRAAGFDVLAYPVDRRLPLGGVPSFSRGLELLDLGVREWIGLVAYGAAGYTSEFWPGPGNASR